MKTLLCVLVSVFASVGAYSQARESKMELSLKPEFHILLLAGQSNMAGRGSLEGVYATPDSRILALSKEGDWVVAKDPIHYDKSMAGVGLALSFAQRYIEDNPGVTVGLVPAACGGSPISAWMPGTYFDQTESYPWDDSISRTNRALEDGVLKGILWHQGESDSHEGLSDKYEGALTDLLSRFRVAFEDKELPIVLGQLGRFNVEWGAHTIEVDQATIKVAEADANAAYVSSEGLESKGDDLHFSSKALAEFGRRYYEAFKAMVE